MAPVEQSRPKSKLNYQRRLYPKLFPADPNWMFIWVSCYVSNPNTWSPVERNHRVYTYVANASWTKGPHNFCFGMDLIQHRLNHWQPEQGGWSPRGGLFFTGGVTALRGGAAPNQFNNYAAFLLGLTNSHGKALQFYDPMRTREWQEGFRFALRIGFQQAGRLNRELSLARAPQCLAKSRSARRCASQSAAASR